ncbi:MAG: D-tyrosyl-tRNA(Tyr) deacylase [Dehalococcoidia bacterium]|nr:MAG: D-tyrosyl-tRNA(Tyr) deacylase [Dehalococcoidia bacterium]
MKALIQRVTGASVEVDDAVIGEIKTGLVVLLGVAEGDEEKDADYLVDKVVNMRIFSDADGKFNLSALEINAGLLVISQFTLLADTRKGRRPSFTTAALPDKADSLYNYFIKQAGKSGLKVQAGSFGAHMLVKIFNDGPVTIMIDSRDKFSV